MKKLALTTFAVLALAAGAAAQATPFAGKWEGTFTPSRPDGTPGNPAPVTFDLTQKGKTLTGKGGPAGGEVELQKGVVDGTKATFELHLSNGSVMKFKASIVKDKLVADIDGTAPDGSPRSAKLELSKAAVKK